MKTIRYVPDDTLLTSGEVASRLNVSLRSLWRMVQQGRFPQPIRKSRRLVRWRLSQVIEWMESKG